MIHFGNLWCAHLFVPGNNVGFLTKLPVINTKNIIIDLEYSTKIPYKIDGRYATCYAIPYIKSVRPDISICVRVNLHRTATLIKEDLRIVLRGRPDAIRIPSVNNAVEIEDVDAIITECERQYGIPEGTVKLHPMVETPQGLKNASQIIKASYRVEAICLGGEDWAFNCGLERTKHGKELEYVKYQLVAIAAEHSICPIDSVFLWLDDEEGLKKDCLLSKSIGFKARATTNPRQLAIINDIYKPSEDKIKWARSVLQNLEETELYGVRHYVANGVISDPLAIYQAQQIISYAEGAL